MTHKLSGSEAARTYIAPLTVIALGALWLSTERAYLPHIDDLFIIAWAKTVATNIAQPIQALSRFLPTAEYMQYVPKLHAYALAGMFRVLGLNLESLLLFRSISFVLAAGIIAIAATRRKLPLVAVFFPLVLCLTMLHTGVRPESTAVILFLTGFVLLWDGESKRGPVCFLLRTLAKTAVVLAPLASSSALAYGAGLLIVSDLRDFGRRPVLLLAAEDAMALTAGVLALGGMVGFDYAGFWQFFSSFAIDAAADLFSFDPPRIFKGAALIVAAYWLRSQLRHSTFPVYAIGLGTILSAVLHNKISISVPLTGLAVLALVDEASQTMRHRKWIWIVCGVLFSVLYFNQVMFAFGSHADVTAREKVSAFAKQARDEGRTLLVDEIAAIHGLRLDIDGTYAWTWSLPFPKARPPSIDTIAEGESWIVSTYTIHSYLHSKTLDGFPKDAPAVAKFLPGTPCLMGRNSCRLPAVRWGYYLIERRNGIVSIRVVP